MGRGKDDPHLRSDLRQKGEQLPVIAFHFAFVKTTSASEKTEQKYATTRRLLKCEQRCIPWRVNGKAAEKPPSHQEEDSEDSDNPEAEMWYYEGKQVTEEPIAQDSNAWVQLHAHGASSSVDKESQKDTEATWNHYLQISTNTSHHMEAVFSMVRKIYGRQPGDPMKDLNVNLAIWRMFMNTTLRAAVHLGKEYDMS